MPTGFCCCAPTRFQAAARDMYFLLADMFAKACFTEASVKDLVSLTFSLKMPDTLFITRPAETFEPLHTCTRSMQPRAPAALMQLRRLITPRKQDENAEPILITRTAGRQSHICKHKQCDSRKVFAGDRQSALAQSKHPLNWQTAVARDATGTRKNTPGC